MRKKKLLSALRFALYVLFSLALVMGASIWWAVGESLPKNSDLTTEVLPNAHPEAPPKSLRVVSYNIGHGQGIKANAWDYRDKPTTETKVSEVGRAIAAMNADLVLLQEVDLDSNRTHHVNEIEVIQKYTKHPYRACAILWQKNYVPFPYWPPEHHIGYVQSANCILSRFPLKNHQRMVFDKPTSNPFWYNLGYIDRGLQKVDAVIGDQEIAVINVHLEAWDIPARQLQSKLLADYIKSLKTPVVLGGDFNTIPLDAPKKTGFSDEPGTNYAHEQTLPILFAALPELKIPSLHSENPSNPFEHYTFPAHEPDRRLDYIFVLGKNMALDQFRVVPEAKEASDHLPVMAIVSYLPHDQH